LNSVKTGKVRVEEKEEEEEFLYHFVPNKSTAIMSVQIE